MAFLVPSCGREATQLIVDVCTDFAVPGELDQLQIDVTYASGRMSSTTPNLRTGGRVTFGILPGTEAFDNVSISVEGRLRGVPIVRGRVRSSFVAGERRSIHVDLVRRCVGVVCGSGMTCRSAGCRPESAMALPVPRGEDPGTAPACGVTRADCNNNPADGDEADLATSRTNCGSCGHACVGTSACVRGVCDNETIVDVSLGAQHGCARRRSGDAVCWGANQLGQLANGLSGAGVVEAIPIALMDVADARGLALGLGQTCVLRVTGSVSCVGDNGFGQLGDGTMTSRTSFAPALVAGAVDQIAAGGTHTCAMAARGAVSCWGRNIEGQVGDGTNTSRFRPAPVLGITAAVAIGAGASHSCAVRAGGTVVCWGLNVAAQLGDGSRVNRNAPVVVVGLDNATSLALGGEHSCAVRTDGTVACWGRNDRGQLGTGTTVDQQIPTQVADLNDVAQVAAGRAFTCARTNGGDVYCWGANDFGQLGDGTNAAHTRPAAVIGLVGATGLDAGDDHACAIRGSGDLSCWGRNESAQLGNGSMTNRSIPGPVVRGP